MLAENATPTGPSIQAVAPVLFYIFAALTVFSAWAIVISQNIVRMSVYLLLTLGGAAGFYFMLNAELLAAIQLIVYAGGTLILIVFGVMLTSGNPKLQLKPKGWELGLAISLALMLGLLQILALSYSHLGGEGHAGVNLPTANRGHGYSSVELIGRQLLTTYLVPFEVAAVLLLVVMIGAAFMARKRADE